MSTDLVKVLRSKCNDLEDQLDAEEAARDAALASTKELEGEALTLQRELEAELQARRQEAGANAEADPPGGGDSEETAASRAEVEELQAALADETERGKQLDEQLRKVTMSAATLQEERSKMKKELEEERKHLEQVQDALQGEEDGASIQAQCATSAKAGSEATLAEARQQLSAQEDALAEVRREGLEHEAARGTALARVQEVERATADLGVELAERGQGLRRREAVLELDGSGRVAGLQRALEEARQRSAVLQQRAQGLEADRQDLQGRLSDEEASEATAREGLARTRGELSSIQVSIEDLRRQAAQMDAELSEEQICKQQSHKECQELSVIRDAALERMQAADDMRQMLEAKLVTAKQENQDTEAAWVMENEKSMAGLHAALAEEQDCLSQLQRAHEALEAIRRDVEERLREAAASRQVLQQELSAAEAALSIARAAAEEGRELAVRMESELAEEGAHAERTCEERARLSGERDSALQQALGAERSRDCEGQQGITLTEQLEAEQRSRAGEAECHQELRRQYAGLVQELEAERRQRLADMDERQKLRRRHGELSRERDHEQKRAANLSRELEAEQSGRAVDAMGQTECREHRDELERDNLAEEQSVVNLKDELEAERRSFTTEARRVSELEAECDRLEVEQKAIVDAHVRATAELGRVAEAHGLERQRAGELQVRLEAVQPMHEDLFARYSAAVEQIDNLKNERERVALEKEGLRESLEQEREEAERLRREREEAEPPGPTQLSLNDVLISVAFEGVRAPLELKPWDTNLEDVVTEWITTVKIKPHLKQSILRYLKHVEESTQAFPVHIEAKLLEVHEQFAM